MKHLQIVTGDEFLLGANLAGNEGEWYERALCREVDGEIFYPEKGGTVEPAKAVCRNCDVRRECLEYALSRNEEFGVWGGLSERERRALKQRKTRGASVQPIRRRQRPGLADHHQAIVEMLERDATWAEIGQAIGYSTDAVKAYWGRQKQAAEQQQELAA